MRGQQQRRGHDTRGKEAFKAEIEAPRAEIFRLSEQERDRDLADVIFSHFRALFLWFCAYSLWRSGAPHLGRERTAASGATRSPNSTKGEDFPDKTYTTR